MSSVPTDAAGTATIVVLAAGEGKRMRSSLPKVLHPILGRTLVGHVLAAAGTVAPDSRPIVVVGNRADQVRAHIAEIAPAATCVLQAEQRGTGHAVRVALAGLDDLGDTVVVINGDTPLLRAQTLADLLATHRRAGAAATVLTARVPDPAGLGRIVRGPDGGLARIVEQRDATPEQREIDEINAGVYVFAAESLRTALGKLSTDNDQGEEYLTDVIALCADAGLPVAAHRAADHTEALGCNDRVELAALRAILRDRINEGWMRAGVTIVDPATTWIDATATLEADAVIEPNTHLRGTTSVASFAVVGPDTTLIDTSVGEGAVVLRAHAVSAEVGPKAQVGPYAYLRPGSKLGRKSKIGTFVETKKADVGEGAKVPHLTYVGDATIGEHTNIGAATVFVNYDGVHKHHTTIGSHARTGADNMFVAPVRVGDGAYTAAGSVITKDVPAGALGVSRAQQRNVDGWVERRRPGTAAAQAAQAAKGAPESTHGVDGQDGSGAAEGASGQD